MCATKETTGLHKVHVCKYYKTVQTLKTVQKDNVPIIGTLVIIIQQGGCIQLWKKIGPLS